MNITIGDRSVKGRSFREGELSSDLMIPWDKRGTFTVYVCNISSNQIYYFCVNMDSSDPYSGYAIVEYSQCVDPGIYNIRVYQQRNMIQDVPDMSSFNIEMFVHEHQLSLIDKSVFDVSRSNSISQHSKTESEMFSQPVMTSTLNTVRYPSDSSVVSLPRETIPSYPTRSVAQTTAYNPVPSQYSTTSISRPRTYEQPTYTSVPYGSTPAYNPTAYASSMPTDAVYQSSMLSSRIPGYTTELPANTPAYNPTAYASSMPTGAVYQSSMLSSRIPEPFSTSGKKVRVVNYDSLPDHEFYRVAAMKGFRTDIPRQQLTALMRSNR